MRNSPWSREELILALDLYFRVGRKAEGPTNPEVVVLSEVLNRLPANASRAGSLTFRNPTGVAMKLGNFLAHDPTYHGAGLARGNKLEVEIWREFQSNPLDLRRLAQAIVTSISEASALPALDSDDEVFPEGEVLTRLHRRRERSSDAVEKKKRQVLSREGRLACEGCGFDFEPVYGAVGRGFAECHHRVPLAALCTPTPVRLADLAILCANCHRMIHRIRPVMDIPAFKAHVAKTKRGH